MADNYTLNFDNKKKKHYNGWIYVVLLYISFIWISLYPATNSLASSFIHGYGDLLNISNPNFAMVCLLILTDATLYWIMFEVLFYFYRYVLTYKIYTFVVPLNNFKIESRIFFIYRNIFYGVFVNLCFLFPYLYELASLVNLIITMITLIAFSRSLVKNYSEPIIAHFVFKNFCYPVFVYEALSIIIAMVEVL